MSSCPRWRWCREFGRPVMQESGHKGAAFLSCATDRWEEAGLLRFPDQIGVPPVLVCVLKRSLKMYP